MAEEERDKSIEQEKAERLDRAIDEFLMKGEHPEELDLEDEELLGLSSEMAQMFSPVDVNPSFKESLKRELLSPVEAGPAREPARGFVRITAEPPRRSLWERLFGGRPMLSFASLAAALLILVGGFYTFQGLYGPAQPETSQLASQGEQTAAAKASSDDQATSAVGSIMSTSDTTPAAEQTEPAVAPVPTVTPQSVPTVAAQPSPQETPMPAATSVPSVKVAAYGPLPQPVADGGFGAGDTPSQAPPGVIEKMVLGSQPPSVPSEAPVYLLQEPDLDPVYTGQLARKLGAQFGFTISPTENFVPKGQGGSPDLPEYTFYTWIDGTRSLEYIPLSGHVSYLDNSWLPSEPNATPSPMKDPVKNEQEAISLATSAAESRGFMPTEYQVEVTTDPGYPIWRVTFARTIEGTKVAGSFTKVVIGDESTIIAIESQIRPVVDSSPYPLKPLTQAVRNVESDNVLTWESFAWKPDGVRYPVATITNVSVQYRERFPSVIQKYLQPIYVIEATVTKDGQIYSFTVYVPAVSPDYVTP